MKKREKKVKKSSMLQARKRGSILDALPVDLKLEIASFVVSSSPSAIKDLINMKITCRMLRQVTEDKSVLRRVAVLQQWPILSWLLHHGGLKPLLVECAEAGNAEASCILGMVNCYYMNERESGIVHLTRAAEKGCIEAMYHLGILHLVDPTAGSSLSLGVKWLERVACESGDGVVGLIRTRKKALKLLREIWVKEGLLRVRQNPGCADQYRCGGLKRSNNFDGHKKSWWIEEEIEAEREFCSPHCRFIYEFNTFVMNVVPSA